MGDVPLFSPDSQRIAYTALDDDKFFAVVDGTEGEKYDVLLVMPIFSPDSKHVAYKAKRGEKYVVVIDGKESKEYDGLNFGDPDFLFIPNSNGMAYTAKINGCWKLVINGVEGQAYDMFFKGSLAFDTPTHLHILAGRNGEVFLVDVDIKQNDN